MRPETRKTIRHYAPLALILLAPLVFEVIFGGGLAFFAVYAIALILGFARVASMEDQARLTPAAAPAADPAHGAELLERNRQLAYLFHQINPHFLYNTLESIRGKAILDGAPDVADMTEALSSFFRYSIGRKQHIVSLRDELRNVEEYFKIQQFRFDNRFSLSVLMDGGDAVSENRMPKLTLQPLVENSIVHGLEKRSGGGHITVRIVEGQYQLRLYIIDDGAGIAPAKLEQVNTALRDASPRPEDRHEMGIALHNISTRLRLLFGQQAGMRVYSVEGAGTTVELWLPRIDEAAGDALNASYRTEVAHES